MTDSRVPQNGYLEEHKQSSKAARRFEVFTDNISPALFTCSFICRSTVELTAFFARRRITPATLSISFNTEIPKDGQPARSTGRLKPEQIAVAARRTSYHHDTSLRRRSRRAVAFKTARNVTTKLFLQLPGHPPSQPESGVQTRQHRDRSVIPVEPATERTESNWFSISPAYQPAFSMKT